MFKVTGSGFASSQPIVEVVTWPGGTKTAGYTSSEWAQTGDLWTTKGDDTPNFNYLRKSSKFLPVNSYFYHKMNTETALTAWSYTSLAGGETYTCSSDTMSYGISHGMLHPTETNGMLDMWLEKSGFDANRVVSKALSNLATRYFDVGTFLGELRETIKMFVGLQGQFIAWLSNMRFLATWEEMWMTYRYGLRPLLSDIQSFIKAVNAKEVAGALYRERAREEFSYHTTDDFDLFNGAVKCTAVYDVNISCVGRVYSSTPPSRFRVGPLTTSWELIQLSFVIDWFLNVGEMLTALEARLEFPDLASTAGIMVSYTSRIDTHTLLLPGFQVNSYGSSALGRGVLVKRFPVSPTFDVSLRPQLTGAKIIDLSIILHQFWDKLDRYFRSRR